MSRCFPYPPPYFGEAQIESIKKEKERLEVEAKKERKREKKEKKKEKKEKKEKRSGKEHELSKELKKNIKRKYEELGLVESKDKYDGPQHHHRSKKPRDEQLETSGLSEEHGQPSINLVSPQRSQDSSKRSNLGSMPSPTVSLTNSGSTLRIKLQSKSRDCAPESQTSKPRVPVSMPQLVRSGELTPILQATKNRDPVSVPQGLKVRKLVPVLQDSKPKTASAPQRPRVDPVQQTLDPRAPVIHAPKLKEPVPESLVPKTREVVSHALKAVPKATGNFGVPKQLSSSKSEIGLVQSSLVSRPSVSKESVMKASIEPCTRTQVPKEKAVLQKPLHALKHKQRDVAPSPVTNQHFIQHSVQPIKSKARETKEEFVPLSKSTPLVQQQVQDLNAKQRVDGDRLTNVLKQDKRPVVSGMPPVVADEPCFSGRILDAGEKRDSKHHHHHSSKKSKRKEADRLFEELILNWKPAVVDQFQDDMDDLDWLMSGAKKRRVENEEGEDEWLSKSSKCNVGGGLLDHTNGMSGSYQTRAVYMPRLDMYQLPYVVPF